MAKSAYRRFNEWFAGTRLGSWFVQTFMERLDPIVFKLTGGRMTLAGPPAIPQLMLTTTGRKSGLPRDVQLVFTEVDDVVHIVASNFGRKNHPAWSLNLDANPAASVLLRGKKLDVRAEKLPPEDVDSVWDRLVANIPMYAQYRERTDRQIKVYRLLS